VTGKDWIAWHRNYDDPASRQSWRLRTVQGRIAATLDAAPNGAIRVASMCAGDGRDLLGVLEHHHRACDVTALLVEQHPTLSAAARERAADLPADVHVVTGDAAFADRYSGVVPIDLLLLCGVFGNIPAGDIERTVDALPALCGPGATVIWTRHRRPPDLVPAVLGWFEAAGFDQIFLDESADGGVCVGGHRYAGRERESTPGSRHRLFRFVQADHPHGSTIRAEGG
jgi:hypothetical protein